MKQLALILILGCTALLSACKPSADEQLRQADEAVTEGNYVEAAHIITELSPEEVNRLDENQKQKLQELILTIELCDKEAKQILEQH